MFLQHQRSWTPSPVHDAQRVGHSPQKHVERILKSIEVPFPRGEIPQIHTSYSSRSRNYKTLSHSRTQAERSKPAHMAAPAIYFNRTDFTSKRNFI